MIKLLTVLGITLLGCLGGQINKSFRRYILPLLAFSYTSLKKKGKKWRAFYYLILIAVLSLGYGEHSKLRKFLKGSDTWTRIVIGLLCSIPFLFWGKWYSLIALPVAFSIRAGGIKIGKYDLLFEDVIKYGVIGILVVI